ncbi:MAG: hypothetical protein K6B46_02495 [Opitutales bacterium]|nr:hypothetical protein [Opitutales bacterium]
MLLTILLALAFVALIYRFSWRGCKVGPIRCLAPLLAFVVAGMCAWLGGNALGFSIFSGTQIPWILRGLLGMMLIGSIVWLTIFAILWTWGRRQIGKDTGENERPILGAVVGCWIGFFIVICIVLVIDAAGVLGETLLASRRRSNSVVANVAKIAVYTRESLGDVPGCGIMATWDPMPDKTRRTLEHLLVIADNPQKMRRFLHSTEIQAVLSLPSVYPVFNSDEIQAMVHNGDINGLLTHPKITAILDDKDFQEAVSRIDYEKLLEELAR